MLAPQRFAALPQACGLSVCVEAERSADGQSLCAARAQMSVIAPIATTPASSSTSSLGTGGLDFDGVTILRFTFAARCPCWLIGVVATEHVAARRQRLAAADSHVVPLEQITDRDHPHVGDVGAAAIDLYVELSPRTGSLIHACSTPLASSRRSSSRRRTNGPCTLNRVCPC